MNKARILIIDDVPGIRNLLSEFLSENYDCVAVGSAEEALALLREAKFDLVISDITLGGISGLEMIPYLIENAPDTVAVMISGEQTIETAIEALRVGAFDYIVKPLDLRHVQTAVERALEHQGLRVAKRRHENYLEEMVKQRTAELERLAHYDALTGLPNQILFKKYLDRALTRAQDRKQKFAVVNLCLDRFKKVNDTLGYALGERLLKRVGRRLANCIREDDALACFGSDEFSLLITGINDTEAVAEVAHNIHECLKQSFDLDGHEVYLTASIGICLYPSDGEDIQTLLKNSSAALFRAKQTGGNNYQFYTSDMNARAIKLLALESNLRRALEREEFLLHYQPQLNINTGEIVGAEALVRWQHPELGLISPADFIPLAEDTGLIVPIGEWVLRAACAQNKRWEESGLGSLRVAVNLSARQFQQQDLVEMVACVLEVTGLSPSNLELELTESSIMKNAEVTIDILSKLKAMDINISIDDFGMGYSSLSYLKRFPISMLKIDQSFVRDTTSHPDDAALVMAIITLAHNLNLKVIAEGVETEEQLRFLHLLRCDEMQGYLLSKPLTAEGFEQFMLERRADKDASLLYA